VSLISTAVTGLSFLGSVRLLRIVSRNSFSADTPSDCREAYVIPSFENPRKGNEMTLAAYFAAEGSESSHMLEWLLVISTAALAIVTALCAWTTYLVHKDASREMSHANDNATDVALAEIDAHHGAARHQQRLNELKKIQHSRKTR
jgi:hypothetical protein